MIETLKFFGVDEISQFTRIGFENQLVASWLQRREFLLDIPWTFTYHTQARAKEMTVLRELCAVQGLG